MIIALTLLIVAVFAVVWLGVGRLIPYLKARAILDHPNERSSHETPTPRGGGVVVTAAVLGAWTLVGVITGLILPILLWVACGLGLAMISWIDDKNHVNTAVRFGLHILAAIAGLWAMGPDALIFQGLLPGWLDNLVAVVVWVWFINLFNFMDGIDGITGVETAAIGIGIAVVAVVAGLDTAILYLGLAAAAAAFAFLRWNWHPAQVFLGDVGSVPLGYLLGGLLLWTAAMGEWAPAAILALYYLADATWTLAHRAIKREKIWQAHRSHFYQRALSADTHHDSVSGWIALVNAGLIAMAVLAAAGHVVAALVFAVGMVAALLVHFQAQSRRSQKP